MGHFVKVQIRKLGSVIIHLHLCVRVKPTQVSGEGTKTMATNDMPSLN